MKGIILYRSKYGATRKYVGWLREKIGFPCVDMKVEAPGDLSSYDIVLYCAGIYAGGVAGLSYLKRNWEVLKDKRVAVMAVCASPYDEKAMAEARNHNLAGPLQGVPSFYARGAWDQANMTFKDRTLCGML